MGGVKPVFFPVSRKRSLVSSFFKNTPKGLESHEQYGLIEHGKDLPSPGLRKVLATFRWGIQHLCENSFHFWFSLKSFGFERRS